MLRAGKIHMEVLWYMSEYALECATWMEICDSPWKCCNTIMFKTEKLHL